MTTKRLWLLLLVTAVFTAVGLATPLEAQDRAAESSPATEAEGDAEDGDELGEIDEILSEDEEDYAGRGVTYDPAGRRDPFRSLLATVTIDTPAGPRPEGPAGMMIDEIEITGVFVTPDGPVAQIQTADSSKSDLIRAGDQLYDGDVVSITREEVVFKQIINDPAALKPFREVVRKLNP